MMPNAPIIGVPKKEDQRYPVININFQPQGMMLSLVWENGFSMTQVLSAEIMDQVVAQWKEVRRQQMTAVDMMNHIQKTKLQ